MTVKAAGRLGGQAVRELVVAGKKARERAGLDEDPRSEL